MTSYRLVPEKVITLLALYGDLFCNLRKEQRPPNFCFSSNELFTPFEDFLRKISGGGIRIAILFQSPGEGEKLGSAVFDLEEVYFDKHQYPQVRHKGVIGRPILIPGWPNVNLWGAFILAIAKVDPYADTYASEDLEAERFIAAVRSGCKPILK